MTHVFKFVGRKRIFRSVKTTLLSKLWAVWWGARKTTVKPSPWC